jgi:polysaccharide export outer membrane protein
MPVPASAQPAATPQAYRLAPGDQISVVVFGQAELSGDLLIDPTGNVRLPFVGPVEVANLTIAECHKRIVERLSDGILTRPSVNVQISALQPVFVLGDVRTAGPHPFKFGMTVKTAIALSGGFGATAPAQGAAVADILTSDERVRQLTVQKTILTIRKARLEAQRNGAAVFPGADQVGATAGGAFDDVLALEKDTFESQMVIQQSQLDLIRAQKPRIESEVEALNGQIAARKRQLDLVRQHIDQYSRLAKQGLGLATTEMQLRLTETTYESEVWALSAQVARLKMDLGALDIRIQDVDAAFKRQVLLDLRDVRDRLKEIDVTLPTAREIRDARLQQAGNVADIEAPRTITITRVRNGAQSSFTADESAPLQPGDIVEIQLRLRRGTGLVSVALPQAGVGGPAPNRNAAASAVPTR